MRIHFKKKAKSGDNGIPPGEYLVRLSRETSQIILQGGEGEVSIPATRRPSKKQIKTASVKFYPELGGPFWIILLSVPPKQEWMAMVRYRPQEGNTNAAEQSMQIDLSSLDLGGGDDDDDD